METGLEASCGLYACDKKQHIQVVAPDAVLRFLADDVAPSWFYENSARCSMLAA